MVFFFWCLLYVGYFFDRIYVRSEILNRRKHGWKRIAFPTGRSIWIFIPVPKFPESAQSSILMNLSGPCGKPASIRSTSSPNAITAYTILPGNCLGREGRDGGPAASFRQTGACSVWKDRPRLWFHWKERAPEPCDPCRSKDRGVHHRKSHQPFQFLNRLDPLDGYRLLILPYGLPLLQ